MGEEKKISTRQFAFLVIMFCLGSSILLIPASIAAHSKQDAWMSAIIGVILGCGVILLLNMYDKRMGHLPFVAACQLLLGRWVGTVVVAGFVFHAFLVSVFMLRYLGDFMTTQILPPTPIQAIHIFFIALIVLAVAYGLETFSRSAEIFFPWLLLFMTLIVASVISMINIDNIRPILNNGIGPIVGGSLVLVGIPYMELVLFLIIMPDVNDAKRRRRTFLMAGFIGGMLILLITFLTVSVLGPYLTVRNLYPSFALSKKINIGEFLKRVEALLAITWFLSIFYKMVVAFYTTALGLSQLLKLKRYHTLLLPIAMLTAIYAIVVYPNIVYGGRFASTAWLPYASIFGLFLPALLLIVARVRGIGAGLDPGSDSGTDIGTDSDADSETNSETDASSSANSIVNDAPSEDSGANTNKNPSMNTNVHTIIKTNPSVE